MRFKRILVAGGAGFIGSNFVRFLQRYDPGVHIVILDALTYAGNLANLADLPDPRRHTFVRGDICNQDLVTRLLRDYGIQAVINFAAETHVDRSIHQAAPFIRTNVNGVFSLLEAMRQVWLHEGSDQTERRLFLHVSTDEVYGTLGPEDPPFEETTPYAPRSPYAASKAAADHLVRAYVHTYRFPAIITNCSNNYGPYQYPEKLIPLTILNALGGQPLPIYGDGNQIRDWLYVEDHAAALVRVLEAGKVGETYNIGGRNERTNLEVVGRICRILDELRPTSPHHPHASLIRFVADRPGHDRRYAMNVTKIQRELGWAPSVSFEEGLRRTVRWYMDNESWVEEIRRAPDYQAWLEVNYASRGERQ